MPSEYLVALPIEDMPLGALYEQGQSLPLHCTLMHWFRPGSGLGRQKVYHELMLLASADSLELVSEKAELFGPNADVPCHVLARNADLNLLHTRLFKFLAKMDSLPEQLEWVGAGYRAHVTDVAGRSFPPGAKFVVQTLVLVKRDEKKIKNVISVHEFGGIPF